MTDKTAPLDQLIAGNMRYVQGNTTAQNKPERRVELAADHIPLAAILAWFACAIPSGITELSAIVSPLPDASNEPRPEAS